MELGPALLLVLAVTRAAGSLSLPPAGGAGRSRDPRASPAASVQGHVKELVMARVAAQAGGPARAGQEQAPGWLGLQGAPARPRPRRCTCFTYKDKECVYYCHLDIIWINTPERIVPYGLASARGSFRGRRALGPPLQTLQVTPPARRCGCVDAGDLDCVYFCAWTPAGSRNWRGAQESPERRKSRPEGFLPRTEQASGV